MKSYKMMLLGIAFILFGICSVLMSALPDSPAYRVGIFEISALLCPIVGMAISVLGYLQKGSD